MEKDGGGTEGEGELELLRQVAGDIGQQYEQALLGGGLVDDEALRMLSELEITLVSLEEYQARLELLEGSQDESAQAANAAMLKELEARAEKLEVAFGLVDALEQYISRVESSVERFEAAVTDAENRVGALGVGRMMQWFKRAGGASPSASLAGEPIPIPQRAEVTAIRRKVADEWAIKNSGAAGKPLADL